MAKLPIAEFLEARLKEYDPTFEVRKGTAFDQLFFKPIQFIVQPLRDESDYIQTSQSFLRILQTTAPDEFSEEAVDALAANLFVTRDTGNVSAGVVRVYYSSPVSREWASNAAVFNGSNGGTYSNPLPFVIAATQMTVNLENSLYYLDIPVQSSSLGTDNDLPVGGIVSLSNDSDAITVSNLFPITGGKAKETNTELITRVKASISVRDLVTGKGFNAVLTQNFPTYVSELQAIGFNDPEMMRDIVFNTHIGGKIDGYFTPPNITSGSKNFVGLRIDPTRQVFTSTNLELDGTDPIFIGYPNIDRTGDKLPVVQEVRVSTAPSYTSIAVLTSVRNLTVTRSVSLTIDGVTKIINLAGATPVETSRNEIVNLINAAFGYKVAFFSGSTFKLLGSKKGLNTQLIIANPPSGAAASCLSVVFGLSTSGSPYTYLGDGPRTYTETSHYVVNDEDGTITRVIGSFKVGTATVPLTTGKVLSLTGSAGYVFKDETLSVFSPVASNDILTILEGENAGDYRVLSVTSNEIVLDTPFKKKASGINYQITRTGIKNGEVVFIQFYFNPLSIDVGGLVKLDDLGKTRGVRPGRASQTITDTAFIRITSIEIIDPLTFEPIGETLRGFGGFGVGGYGEGPYGIGSGRDYYLSVNSPAERFSMFEDSLIVINSSFQNYSFKVSYEYVPECAALHDFVRSDGERVLDGDILMKHFLPAYVSGTISYAVDITDSTVLGNDELTALVKKFISTRKAGSTLTYSEISQYIIRLTDPYDRFGTKVKKFTLTGRIQNTDGTETVVTGTNSLKVPTLDPFPRLTNAPLSPRITHWISDQIVLERVAADAI